MIVLGITGGVGTGKTTVARMFEARGAYRLDADRLAHRAIARGTAGWREVRRVFGTAVCRANGTIDRHRLAQRVFTNRRRLAQLNRLVHPRVRRLIHARLRSIRHRRPRAIVVIEVPLLIEAGFHRMMDMVLLVTATRRQQVARLRRTTAWSRREIRQRIAAQWPPTVTRRYADVMITNTGTTTDTRRHVNQLWSKLVA